MCNGAHRDDGLAKRSLRRLQTKLTEYVHNHMQTLVCTTTRSSISIVFIVGLQVVGNCSKSLEIHIFTERTGAADLTKGDPVLTNVTRVWAGGIGLLLFLLGN